jgi:hypothetical protein
LDTGIFVPVDDGEELVERLRRAARQLQKDLAAREPPVARAAAVRFAQLPAFAQTPIEELIARPGQAERAHALAVVALEHGFVSWGELLAASLPLLQCVTMHADRMSLSLNRWFTTWDAAAASRQADGGWLLPYRRQFFVTGREGVRELGLDPDDPDWARIGWDWVRPRDAEAHLRLARARFDAMLARGEELP